jgi:hypothetical protein
LLGNLTLASDQAVERDLHFAEVSEHQEGDEGAVVMDGGHHGIVSLECPVRQPTGGSRAPERFPRGEGAANMVMGL